MAVRQWYDKIISSQLTGLLTLLKALVIGSNLMLGADWSMLLGNMNFLSPDSLCYSFDHRANGYARGEGVIGIILKRLSDAVLNGDTIRGVIRSHGVNQDGHTPGLTQPSAESQEALIREVYEKSDLDFGSTRLIETHGQCPFSRTR